MTFQVSQRVKELNPSQTLSISALANKMIVQGKPVVNLSVGQPHFPMPATAVAGVAHALDANITGYTAVDGTASLKKAITEKFSRENGLAYTPEQILVSSGAKHSIFNVCQAVLNPGEEVLVPVPYWLSYPEIIRLAGAKCCRIVAGSDQGYKITASQLEQAITSRTRLLMINSPNNPSGAVYTTEELKSLAEVLLKHPQVMVCTDDIYEHFVYRNQPFANILNVCPDLYERTVVINGVSKAYSMTGLRIGYAAAAVSIIAAMKKIQSQSTSNPCSLSQVAAEFVLNGTQSSVREMKEAYDQNRCYLFKEVSLMDGLDPLMPQGAFYLFVDCAKIIGRIPTINDDLDLCKFLLSEHNLSTVPGVAFGMRNHIRISYSVDRTRLEQAVTYLQQALKPYS